MLARTKVEQCRTLSGRALASMSVIRKKTRLPNRQSHGIIPPRGSRDAKKVDENGI